ncbi:hypothetical protein, conserved [Eimeria tenella]|uniref:Uncharacterized protein n=1 Tax=Eimeria tenella TaxID=5802 RepID=H9B9R3_EIMTE|nr:hypothetical protein, conserved [Eimeria tenella]AET50723.1 hypothetical protein [Eimeria tenella]CDJ42468.1 hypothetical protein, conserved [Eimeria tenella]|eukprot:XP_013233218.1 hypothetical protein, conserved [Eimeria tenella]
MASPQAAHFNTVESGTVSLDQRERAEALFQNARLARKRRQAVHRGLRISIVTLVGLAAVLLILTCVHRIGLRRVAGRHDWRRLANSSPGGNPSGDGEEKNNDECEPMLEGAQAVPASEETGQETGGGPVLGEESFYEEAPSGTDEARMEELQAHEPMELSGPEPETGAAAPAPSTSSGVRAPPSPPRKRKAKTKHLEKSSPRSGSPPSSVPQNVAECLLGVDYFESLALDMSNGNPAHAGIGKLEAIQQAADNTLSCAENAEGAVSHDTMSSLVRLLGLLLDMFQDEMTKTRILLTETDLGPGRDALQDVMENLNEADNEMRAIDQFISSHSPYREGLFPAVHDNADAMKAIAIHMACLELGVNSAEALADAYEEKRTSESRERLEEFLGVFGSFGEHLSVLLQWMDGAGLEGPRRVLSTYSTMLDKFVGIARERLHNTNTSLNVSPLASPVGPMISIIPFDMQGFTVASPARPLQDATLGLRNMSRKHRSSPTAESRAQLETQITLCEILIGDAQQQVSQGQIADPLLPEVVGCICELTEAIGEVRNMLERS